MKALIFAATVALLMTFSAQAQTVRVMGWGAGTSCGTWTAEREQHRGRGAQGPTWVIGYLSGAAVNGAGNILQDLDFDGVMGWIDNYCRANPLTSIDRALQAFIRLRTRPQ